MTAGCCSRFLIGRHTLLNVYRFRLRNATNLSVSDCLTPFVNHVLRTGVQEWTVRLRFILSSAYSFRSLIGLSTDRGGVDGSECDTHPNNRIAVHGKHKMRIMRNLNNRDRALEQFTDRLLLQIPLLRSPRMVRPITLLSNVYTAISV